MKIVLYIRLIFSYLAKKLPEPFLCATIRVIAVFHYLYLIPCFGIELYGSCGGLAYAGKAYRVTKGAPYA
jgi:hypothetical protein